MIEFGWGDYDESYSVMTFTGKWTSHEFAEIIRKLYRVVAQTDKVINMIVDLRYSAAPPMNIMGIATRAIASRPANFGRVIVVSRSNIWRRLYAAITRNRKVIPLDIHFVESVDDAYKLLVAATNG